MSFLFPGAAWFLLAVPVVIALYFLKTRRVRLEVPSLLDWKRVALDNRKRALFKKLRHPLSLLLSLLILVLVILALARPALRLLGRDATRVLIVLDQRIGMQAVGAGGTRFEAARGLAQKFLREAGVSRQMAILGTMSGELEVFSGFTSDAAALLETLEKMEAGDGGGPLEQSLRRGVAIAQAVDGEVVLITDRAPHGQSAAGVNVVRVGTPLANTGISRFDVRRSPADAGTLDVFVESAHAGPHPVTRELEIYRNGELADVRDIELRSGEVLAKSFALIDAGGAEDLVFEARLTGPGGDALPADDRAWSVVPARKPGRVLLVSEGNVYLEGVLNAGVVPVFEVLSPDSFRAEMAAGFDVVVLDRTVPAGWSWEAPPAGNWLFCGAWPGKNTGVVDAAETTWVDAASPLLRSLRLDGVRWYQVPQVEMPGLETGWKFQAPVRSLEQPLLIAGEKEGTPSQRVVGILPPLGTSDLPLRVAFPVLINNALAWLAGEDMDRVDTLPVGIASQVPLQQIDPATKQPLLVEPSTVPTKAGVYLQKDRLVAVSRTDWAASDTWGAEGGSAQSAPAYAGPGRAKTPFRQMDGIPPWVWFALGAWSLLLLEWRFYHRRKTE